MNYNLISYLFYFSSSLKSKISVMTTLRIVINNNISNSNISNIRLLFTGHWTGTQMALINDFCVY